MNIDRYENLFEECFLIVATREGIECATLFMCEYRVERSEIELEELLVILKSIGSL